MPPEPKVPPARRPAEIARDQARDVVRDAIVDAAERVFARAGFADSKVADIAREAGIATGTLYNYFDGKEAIFQSICVHRHRQALDEVRAVLAGGGEPLELLRRQVEWAFGHIEDHAERFQLWVQMGVTAEWQLRQLGGEDAARMHEEHMGFTTEHIASAQAAGQLRDDVPARELAYVFSGMVHAYIHNWLTESPRTSLRERSGRMFDLFTKGATFR
jgi:TetR/AcrR family fatty acid metabolism transcriptional regulator